MSDVASDYLITPIHLKIDVTGIAVAPPSMRRLKEWPAPIYITDGRMPMLSRSRLLAPYADARLSAERNQQLTRAKRIVQRKIVVLS